MNFFNDRKKIEMYFKMAKNLENKEVFNKIEYYIPKKSTILELGSGPGIDLIRLSKDYEVTGSDYSDIFLEYLEHTGLEILKLDVTNLKIDRKFDLIFSNKVLNYVKKEEFLNSLEVQGKKLNENGSIIFTLWSYNDDIESYDGLIVQNYTIETLKKIIPSSLEIVEITPYTEEEENDSCIVVLKSISK